jgi:hypothetical protein
LKYGNIGKACLNAGEKPLFQHTMISATCPFGARRYHSPADAGNLFMA